MILIVILYIVSFGLSLLNSGAYWDDWAVIVNKDPELIKSTCDSFGQILAPYIFNSINIFHSFTAYRIVTFLVYLFSGYFFYSILSTIKEIDSKKRLLLTIFFLLFPANDARVVLVILWYSVCYFFFYFGWWLTTLYLINKKVIFRLLALVTLILSFSINSMLFFYILILAYIAFKQKNQLKSRKDVCRLIINHIDFILLPVFFFLYKQYFFPLPEINKGYNEITAFNLLTAFYRSVEGYGFSFLIVLLSSFYSLFNMSLITTVWQAGIKLELHPYVSPLTFKNIFDLLKETIFITSATLFQKNLISNLLIIASGITAIFISLRHTLQTKDIKKKHYSKDTILFILGCISFYVAVFPYYVVNKIPTILEGFSDRHLLLTPLGASFMIVYGIQIIGNFLRVRINIIIAIYSILIAMFVSYHLKINVEFLKDQYKQMSVIEQMKRNQELKNNTTFLFIDNTIHLNAKHKPYAFYEYTGFMKKAFGDEKRFGSSIDEFKTYNQTINESREKQLSFPKNNGFLNTFNKLNNMQEYIVKNPEFIIEINVGSYELSDLNLFYLIYFKHFDKESFTKAVNNIIKLSTSSITQK
ncbi:MAG: hypothetical protein WCV81_01860 [Microgenomates group bacterium]